MRRFGPGPQRHRRHSREHTGLDLHHSAGAQEFYARLKHAADVACTHGNRVDLKPSGDPVGCSEKALGEAIRSANLPLLTQVYLGTHTLRQAAAYGIEPPELSASQLSADPFHQPTPSFRACAGTQASTLDLRNPLVRRFLGTSEHALAREAPLNAHITALILISSIPLRQVKV